MTGDLRDDVSLGGVTVYAPTLACRPVDVADYPPALRKVWLQLIAEVGVEPDIYPGSSFEPCEDCAVTVAVGPRQQEAREGAKRVGLAAHVYCMLCAVQRQEAGAVMHLGNPFQRQR